MARKISLNQETKKHTEQIKMSQRRRRLYVVGRNRMKSLQKYTFPSLFIEMSIYSGGSIIHKFIAINLCCYQSIVCCRM